jgi:hypothetical protein
MMKFYTQQHPYYCGIDLYARKMCLCMRDTPQYACYSRTIAQSHPTLLKDRVIAVGGLSFSPIFRTPIASTISLSSKKNSATHL